MESKLFLMTENEQQTKSINATAHSQAYEMMCFKEVVDIKLIKDATSQNRITPNGAEQKHTTPGFSERVSRATAGGTEAFQTPLKLCSHTYTAREPSRAERTA